METMGADMDATDRRLLASLREDARLPVSQLAQMLDIPRAQVYARLERLEKAGVIAGYTLRLGEAFTRTRVRAQIMIKTLPRLCQEVEARLSEIPEISAIYAVSGEWDIIVRVEAANTVELTDLINAIGLVEGVERTTTAVILAARLER